MSEAFYKKVPIVRVEFYKELLASAQHAGLDFEARNKLNAQIS